MSLLHTSVHLVFGLPLFLFPGIAFVITLLTTWSSSILITCPYHFSLLSVIFLDACTTFVVPRMCSFLVLSFLVTPHIHLSILISFTSILDSCRLVVAHVSAPYSITGLTTVLYTFPFSFTGILLSHNSPLHFFQFIHSAPIRFAISVSIPLPSSMLVPRYPFNFLTKNIYFTTRLLLDTIQEGFPDDRRAANHDIAAFWTYCDSLNVTDGVIYCIVTVLSYPRLSVTMSFESIIPHTREYRPWSHELDLSYSGRVWPMPSGLSENTALPVTGMHRHKQPRSDPVARPFNPVRNSLFLTGDLLSGDRLYEWVEIFKAPHGTSQTGDQGLIAAPRALSRPDPDTNTSHRRLKMFPFWSVSPMFTFGRSSFGPWVTTTERCMMGHWMESILAVWRLSRYSRRQPLGRPMSVLAVVVPKGAASAASPAGTPPRQVLRRPSKVSTCPYDDYHDETPLNL